MKSEKWCPFCHNHIIEIVTSTRLSMKGLQVECDNCGARGPIDESKDAAIAAWEHGTPDFYKGKGHRD
jgi:Lar family restriction alleviation protein